MKTKEDNSYDFGYEYGKKGSTVTDAANSFTKRLADMIPLPDDPSSEQKAFEAGYDDGSLDRYDDNNTHYQGGRYYAENIKSKTNKEKDRRKFSSTDDHKNKYISQVGAGLPEGVKKVIRIVVLGALVSLVWVIMKIGVPVIILNVAVFALLISFISQDWRRPFNILSFLGAVYIVVDYQKGWQTKALVEAAPSFAAAIPKFLYLNVTSGLISAYFFLRDSFNRNNPPAEGQSEFSKRNVIIMCCLLATGAVTIGLQKYFEGKKIAIALQNSMANTETDQREYYADNANLNVQIKEAVRNNAELKSTDSIINVTISNFEVTKLKNESALAQPVYEKAKQAKKYSDDLYSYIESIRDMLYKEGGGIDQSTGLIKNWADSTTVGRIMIQEGRAKPLKEEVDLTRKDFLVLLDTKENEPGAGLININTYGNTGSNGVIYSWANSRFGTGVTLAAAIKNLLRLQIELRHTESDILLKLLGVNVPKNSSEVASQQNERPADLSRMEQEIPPPQKAISASGPKAENANGIDPGITKPGTGIVGAPPPPAIFSFVDQMPHPEYNFKEYLDKNLHYPAAAREGKIEGRVIVKFVVNENGLISNPQIVRGIGGGCDEEALRIVAAMPKWQCGKQNDRPVKVYFTQPIQFKLE